MRIVIQEKKTGFYTEKIFGLFPFKISYGTNKCMHLQLKKKKNV